jgi:anti-anti-sigma regulatory factor
VAPQYSIEIASCSPVVCVVALGGQQDLACKPGVTTALTVASSHLNVLVDLSECTYIDSAVMSELFLAATRLQERDGALELVVGADAHALRRTLELAGAPKLMRYHETRAVGIGSLDSAGRIRALRHARQDLREITEKLDRLRTKADARRIREASKGAGVTVVRAKVTNDALVEEPHAQGHPGPTE